MALVGFSKPKSVFLALPFEIRDTLRGYKETLLVLEDKFGIKIEHGDQTSDAVGILERAFDLMKACRVRVFDMTGLKPNIAFEFGMAKGAGLQNVYAVRKKTGFGPGTIPTMMNNIDCPSYSDSKSLEKALTKALTPHFWPTDLAFTMSSIDWLANQIRQLTYPGCETDRIELADATGIEATFVTQAIRQFFVEAGDAVALTVGNTPMYRFDYNSLRSVPDRPATISRLS